MTGYVKIISLVSLLAAFLILAAGCGPSKSIKGSANKAAIQTELEMISETTLRVTYVTGSPSAELFFSRTPDKQRQERWAALDENIIIEHRNGIDVIKHINGEKITSFSFHVPMTYTHLPKDYAPFMPYRENGVLIHSGRFQTCLSVCESDEAQKVFPMSFLVPETEHIILFGEVLSETTSWIDTNDGTMIYVGRGDSIETDFVISIVDPLLPDDVQKPLNELFPDLMAYFANRLGGLDQKPMLFASFDRYAKPDGNPLSNNFSSQGGVLPGQVFMHFSGDAWFEDEDIRGTETTGFLLWFFAHEAGHLYQRGADYFPTDGEAWIHEGGADAFAAIALADLKSISPAYITRRKNEAIELCLKGLEAGSLEGAAERGDFKNLYSCGMIIQLAIDKSVRAKSQGQSDLYDIWALFLEQVKAGQPWSQKTFLELVETHADKDTTGLAMSIIAADKGLTSERLIKAIE